MQRKIRLIAADMDGTLLNSSSRLTDFTIATIHKAQALGIIFAICSGRYLENIQIVLKDAGINCPIISLNGCIVQAGERRVHTDYMKKNTVRTLYETFEQLHVSYYLFGPGSVTTRYEGKPHHSVVEFAPRLEKEYGVTFTMGEAASKAASYKEQFKYFVYQDQGCCTLDAAFDAAKDISGIGFTRSGNENFEIMPVYVNKMYGIEHLARFFNIRMNEVMAIGDHDNDVPMLKAAGMGIAVANASDKAKEAADIIVESNDNDGAAKAILQFVL